MRNFLSALLFASLSMCGSGLAAIVVNIAGVPGDSKIAGFESRIVAESFSFGMDRSFIESSRSGTSDLELGRGELRVIEFTTRFDKSSAKLAQAGVAGTSLASAAIEMLMLPEGGKPFPFLLLHVEPAFIKAWGVHGNAEDLPAVHVEIWYEKVTLQSASTRDGSTYTRDEPFLAWDQTREKSWDPAIRLDPSNSVPQNRAPTAQPASFAVAEGATLEARLSGSDPDADPLSYALVQNPAKGSVVIQSDGRFSYTPAQGQTGTDSFQFRVYDGALHSAAATIAIQINPVIPQLESISPTFAVANSAGFTLTVHGTAFVNGAEVLWDGQPRSTTRQGDQNLTIQVQAADIATQEPFATRWVQVRNPSGEVSTPAVFAIHGDDVGTSISGVARPGDSATVSLPASSANPVRIDATAQNSSQDHPLAVALAQFESNPTEETAFQLADSYFDIQAIGADASDSLQVIFYYPNTIIGIDEEELELKFFDGSAWQSVRSGGGLAPLKNPQDLTVNGVGYGGTVLVTFDASSAPAITQLSGTMFALGAEDLPPEIHCPENLTVGNDTEECGARVVYALPAVTDDRPGVTLNRIAGLGSGALFPIGTTLETYTAIDSFGHEVSCSFTVTVSDTERPKVRSKDIVVQLDGAGHATIEAADVDAGSTDNCAIQSLSVAPASFDCSHAGRMMDVLLTVTDVHGNAATAQATVSVRDEVKPIARSRDITVFLDANGAARLAPADVEDGSTDACGIASFGLSKTVFGCADLGVNTVILTVTDNHGNVATTPATVTVKDLIAPVLDCPARLEVDAESPAGAAVPFVVVARDNCDPLLTASSQPASGSLFPIGLTTVTSTAVDGSQNSSRCEFVVKVLSPAEMLTRLIAYVQGLEIDRGLKNSLKSKLDNALVKLDAGQSNPAREMLSAAINQAEAQRSKQLTADQAARIIDAARRIVNALPAPPNNPPPKAKQTPAPLAGADPSGIRVTLARSEGGAAADQIVIQWSGGTLQSSASLLGPWQDLPDATSPYSSNIEGNRRFFRVVSPGAKSR